MQIKWTSLEYVPKRATLFVVKLNDRSPQLSRGLQTDVVVDSPQAIDQLDNIGPFLRLDF